MMNWKDIEKSTREIKERVDDISLLLGLPKKKFGGVELRTMLSDMISIEASAVVAKEKLNEKLREVV